MKPRPKRSAATWADEEREEPGHAPRGGKWETAYIPVWLPILAAASDARTQQISLMTSSQVGKTSALLSILGHRFGDGPRTPCLFVMESQKKAREISAERVAALINDCPQLDAIHSKGKKDGMYEKWLGGVPLRMAWAGSAGALASHPIGLLLGDEIDRWPESLGDEGDPLSIARARTIMYPRSLIVVASSPLTEDESRIQSEFDNGSREVAEWACPSCGFYHRPLSDYLHCPKEGHIEDRCEAAQYECPRCHERHAQPAHRIMIDSVRMWPYERRTDGRYVASIDASIRHKHRSFWISGFHSPVQTFASLMKELIEAHGSFDSNKIKTTINTQFGELYRGSGERPEESSVRAHMLEYSSGTKPYGSQYTTCGIDVQHDCLYYAARTWGAQGGPFESWLVEAGVVWGNPTYDSVWLALTPILKRLGVQYCLIDSGWKPNIGFARPDNMVHRYCRGSNIAHAARGRRTQDRPVKLAAGATNQSGGVQKGREVRTINVTYFKSFLYGRIRSVEDSIGAEDVPDLWHLPADVPADYPAQVVAEEWIQTGEREGYYYCPRHRPNHYLDCEVLALAACWHHMENRQWSRLPDETTVPREAAAAASNGRAGGVVQRPGFERESAF